MNQPVWPQTPIWPPPQPTSNQPTAPQQNWNQQTPGPQQTWSQPSPTTQQTWNQPQVSQPQWNQPPPTSQQTWNQPPPPPQQTWNQPPPPPQQTWNQPPPPPQQTWNPAPPPAEPPRTMKLDQDAMPSAAQLVNDEIEAYKKDDRQLKFSSPATLPPLVATLESQQLQLSLIDQGCVRPCHMRSTIYRVPTNKDILATSGLEFSVVVKPFDEREVEGKFYVPLSYNQIVRCNRCKAYVNPMSRNAQCCICNYPSQGNIEIDQRPELNFGSYEFRVTPEYYRDQIAESRRPHIIFAIEMTTNSRHLIHYISKHLAGVIKSHFPTDFLYSSSYSPLVGFVTFNSKIVVYDVKNGGHAYVISDMTTVTECTSTSKFLVDPAENFQDIEKFLSSLVDISNEQVGSEQQTVLGPVLEAALKTCAHDTSNYFEQNQKQPNAQVIPTGKVYVLMSSAPTAGDDQTPGRLTTVRNIDEMKRSLGTENESKVLSPEGKYYTQLAQKCITDYASGVELFFFPPHPRAYLNIATLGELTRITGTGVINKYHITSMDNFLQDLKFSLKSTMAFDASMRVRTSTGISAVKYLGNFNNISGPNLEMSAVNTNSNFIVQMKYDDKLSENELVVIQFAMIYTSVCGERRVRVHNLALGTCSNLADLYKSACCDTLTNVMVRETIEKMRAGSSSPKAAKEQLTSRVVNILAAYRKHCTDNQASNSTQLILPEGLKLLPVYLCGALKCDAIDGGAEMQPDDKVLAQLNLLGSLPWQSQATIYPRMYAIDSCASQTEATDSPSSGDIPLENNLSNGGSTNYGYDANLTRCFCLAIEKQLGQCYVLENGYYLFIFFPATDSGKKFLASVYGQRQDDPDLIWEYRDKESNESKFLEELIARITLERRRALRISVIRQARDKMEHVFRTFLYEDKKRSDGVSVPKWENATYVDILCYLHGEIRSKLSQ